MPQKRFRIEGGLAIFEDHDLSDLGGLLLLASEFWFGSTQAPICRVLAQPFQARRLMLPCPPPPDARRHEEALCCPVQFDTGLTRWAFYAAWLAWRLPDCAAGQRPPAWAAAPGAGPGSRRVRVDWRKDRRGLHFTCRC